MPDAIARRRKYSCMCASPRRFESAVRYTADKYAQTVTASTPPTMEVALIQLDHGSPALPPLGTRPDAIAPATVPRQNGTSTDDAANAAPKLRWSRVRNTVLRNANDAPR